MVVHFIPRNKNKTLCRKEKLDNLVYASNYLDAYQTTCPKCQKVLINGINSMLKNYRKAVETEKVTDRRKKMIYFCPNCSASLRQKIQIIVSCSIYQTSFDKTDFLRKSVQVETVPMNEIIIYCPKCLWTLKNNEQRRSITMASWKYTLNISNIWNNDDIPIQTKGKTIAAKIRETFPRSWFDWDNNNYNEEIDELAKRFENITGYDEVSPLQEFNDCIDELYDFGDQNVSSWRWPTSKMAWVETIA